MIQRREETGAIVLPKEGVRRAVEGARTGCSRDPAIRSGVTPAAAASVGCELDVLPAFLPSTPAHHSVCISSQPQRPCPRPAAPRPALRSDRFTQQRTRTHTCTHTHRTSTSRYP